MEFAHLLNDRFGPTAQARRSQQFMGTAQSADVTSNLPFHFEVKRCDKLMFRDWWSQLRSEATEKWVCWHSAGTGAVDHRDGCRRLVQRRP